jgi:DNA-binding CsgD family transcriptional regulator
MSARCCGAPASRRRRGSRYGARSTSPVRAVLGRWPSGPSMSCAPAGARPRRDRGTGRDALTVSEHRIAQLAIEGMTNRQIAQALFITRKTVETHLERVFRKLGIHSRAELERALAEEEAFAPVV